MNFGWLLGIGLEKKLHVLFHSKSREFLMKTRLFICYFNKDFQEVLLLTDLLKLRGIPVWIDKKGGFSLGNPSPKIARKCLNEDCFGILFYATSDAFSRPFIQKVEIDEALKVKKNNPDFLIIPIPRGIDL